MSTTDWQTHFIDPQTGKQVHIADAQRIVSFSWIHKHLRISRATLYRAKDAGELQTLTGRPSFVHTGFLWNWLAHKDSSL